MILGIICFIFCCLGIYGFYNEIYLLTYIGFVLCLIENIIGRLNNSSKTIIPFLIGCIIGYLITKNFWLGIAIGACYENAIMFIGGTITLVAIFKSSKNKK